MSKEKLGDATLNDVVAALNSTNFLLALMAKSLGYGPQVEQYLQQGE
jgi:hypothetical protein